jgi:hypothetical protein
MRVRFETFVIAAAALLACAFVGFDAHFRLKETQIVERLNHHGFSRTAVITALGAQPDDPDFDARDFISGARHSDGDASSVLTRRSLSELSSLPVVAKVLAIAKSSRKLSLQSGVISDVNCFNVSAEFGSVFKLAGVDRISPGVYTPSAVLRRSARMSPDAGVGSLGVADEVVRALPPSMRERIDWSKASVPIRLSNAALELPADSPMFDNALFTTGREARLDVPGLFLFPTVNILVKLRDEVPVDAGMAQLASFIARATPADPKATLSLAPLMQFFSDELGVEQYRAWGAHVRQGIGSGCILLFSALVLIRQRRIRQEIALRRAVGVPAGWAAWLSIRALVTGLGAGVAVGAIVGAGLVCVFTATRLPALAPSLAGIGIAIASAAVVLVSGAGLFSRVDLASQLKRL